MLVNKIILQLIGISINKKRKKERLDSTRT